MKTVVPTSAYVLNGEVHHASVLRDKHGKFYVRIDGVMAVKRMTAEDLVKWFAGVFFYKVSK